MATIRTAIELQDNFTNVLYQVINSVNLGLSAMEDLHQSMNSSVSTASIDAAREAIDQATISMRELEAATQRIDPAIDSNINKQGQFNREIEKGADGSNGLLRTIKGAVAAYATAQAVGEALDLSDTFTNTTARLNLMNDGLQTTQDLQNMIYLSAERSRGSYQATADAVSKLGLMAGDAFGSSEEIIAFMEQVNKQFTIAGTEAAGIDAAMLQLTQAMGSGVLRGEEFNSILEQAPNIIQAIADYMNVPKGQLKDLAAEGQISADIVKAAMFSTADDTNAKFESMPKTFSQIWTSFQNTALMAFQPVLQRMNEIANSEKFQKFVNNAIGVLSMLAGVALKIFDLLVGVAEVIADNWSWIAPIIYVATAALIGYCAILGTYNAIQFISNGIKAISIARSALESGATLAKAAATKTATDAQVGLNAAMLACPITWIIILIIALIAIFVMFTEQVVGAIWWLGALFKNIGLWIANCGIATWEAIKNIGLWFANLGLAIWAGIKNVGLWFANLGLGIWEVLKACASNVGTAFYNAWISIQIGFWGMVDVIMQGLKSLAEKANSVLGWMGVDIDTSGLDFASRKIDELNDKKENYSSIGEAWNDGFHTFEYDSLSDAFSTFEVDWGKVGEGYNTFDVFEKGWGSEAYGAGAEIGAGIHDKIMGVFGLDMGNGFNADNYTDLSNYGAGFSGISDSIGDISENTEKIADGMEITEEDLKYLRDIAEQETINRFTTAEITIEQTNHNTVSGKLDLDGVVYGLTDAVNEAVDIITEGVHV